MADSLVRKTTTGIIWSAVDRFSAQALAFVFNILIARLLLPSDYGVVAMLEIFLAISQTFIDSGFGNALIRKPDRTEEDINTVFYFNIVVSVIAYALLWFTAPLIAAFYKMPMLTPITRWVSLKLIINAFGSIQGVLLSIRLEFKSRAKIRVLVSVVVGVIGLILAKRGYGVWVLVTQQLLDSLLGAMLLWAVIKWKPRRMFSWTSFREMFSYGSRILMSGLIGTLYGNLYSIVIGKFFSSADLGKYSKAKSLAVFPNNNINAVIMSVMFPVLSSLQNDKDRLILYYKQTLALTSFVTIPVTLGMATIAKPLVLVLLTDKWAGMIPLFQVLCVAAIWAPLNVVNINLLQVLGRSDLFLRIEIYKKIVGILMLVIMAPFGIFAMCIGSVISSVINLIINATYTKQLIGYSLLSEIKDVSPSLLLSLGMSVVVYVLSIVHMALVLQLIIPVFVGICVYFLCAYLFRVQAFYDLLGVIKKSLGFEI